ncbi:hypothetical protein E2C01_044644 [Portunus trituberculatus]|uniref:Uncharacterized protein n=1 Tax=Portunus trituberculatus TaxID=210409 RepID=A0A5B7FSN8_PORTR|nr:hypothetical protein [Portunus trituberculatus]
MEVTRLMATVFTILILHVSFSSCIKSLNSKQTLYGNASRYLRV